MEREKKSSGLPRSCVPCPQIEDDGYDWFGRHELKCAAVREKQFKAVFIGDSLTHYWTAESAPRYGGSDWNERYGKYPLLNLGFGFDRTQNVLWRIANGELDGQSPELFVVNIGTNQFSITQNYSGDTPETAAAGVMQVLNELHTRFPQALTICMALFPRGGKMEQIAKLNAMLARQVPVLPKCLLLDVGRELALPSGEPDPVNYQPDLCHLNVSGYRIWGSAVAPYVDAVCSE